jgi:hypothetical protein
MRVLQSAFNGSLPAPLEASSSVQECPVLEAVEIYVLV